MDKKKKELREGDKRRLKSKVVEKKTPLSVQQRQLQQRREEKGLC